jgi:8-oxo-dGTP diphosphatase
MCGKIAEVYYFTRSESGGRLMKVNLYGLDEVKDAAIEYVVILPVMDKKWILSRHKNRKTWEFAGGRREYGETPEEAAARELYEETGAEEYKLVPVAVYSVVRDRDVESFGKLYYAEVERLGDLPDYEMAEIQLFQDIPGNLTYPLIYPSLISRVIKGGFGNAWYL